MTAPATIAREAAFYFEAKKSGFGQAQDGWSITLRVQHDDLPSEVKNARKGTRYMVALVEIGDDEQPVVHTQTREDAEQANTPTTQDEPDTAAPDSELSRVPARRKFEELEPKVQAGILCNEIAFQKFLHEKHLNLVNMMVRRFSYKPTHEEIAAACVRHMCGVDSRVFLTKDNPEWSALVLAYRLWQREPEFVG